MQTEIILVIFGSESYEKLIYPNEKVVNAPANICNPTFSSFFFMNQTWVK